MARHAHFLSETYQSPEMRLTHVLVPAVVVVVAALVLAGTVLWTRAMIALEIDLRPSCGSAADAPLDDVSDAARPSCALGQLALRSQCATAGSWGPNVRDVRWLGDAAVAVCVRYVGGVVAVAFRGTQTTEDAIANMDTTLVDNPYGAGRVHRGFLERYQTFRDELRHVGADWRVSPSEWWLTGHSLGAALATLATFDLRPARAAVFGSPKVGDGACARALEACAGFASHVNLVDPVCTMPARGPYVAPVRALVVFACDKGCWSRNHSMATYLAAACENACGAAAATRFEPCERGLRA